LQALNFDLCIDMLMAYPYKLGDKMTTENQSKVESENKKPVGQQTREALIHDAEKDIGTAVVNNIEKSVRASVSGRSATEATKAGLTEGKTIVKDAGKLGAQGGMKAMEHMAHHPDQLLKNAGKGMLLDAAWEGGKELLTPEYLAKKQKANRQELEAAAKRDGTLSMANANLKMREVAAWVPFGKQIVDSIDSTKAAKDLDVEEAIRVRERDEAIKAPPTKAEREAYEKSEADRKAKIADEAAKREVAKKAVEGEPQLVKQNIPTDAIPPISIAAKLAERREKLGQDQPQQPNGPTAKMSA
jgi:hypothetical protein